MPYWYHGTTKEASEIILKEGFRAGTYFSKEMASSLVMGGDYVFWVWFNEDPTKCWEYICPEPIGKDQILLLVELTPRFFIIQKKLKEESGSNTMKKIMEKIRFSVPTVMDWDKWKNTDTL